MNANAYRQILVARGEKDLEMEHGEYKYLIAFRTDLLKDKLVWTNDFRNDWHNYLKAKHPLYGVFKAPKCDAFSRKERGIVLFLGIGLAAIWSMGIMTVENCSFESGEETCEKGMRALSGEGIMFSLIGAIIKFVANSFLKMIATCAPCQKGCCLIFKSFCECIGQCIMCVWTCLVVTMLIGFFAATAVQGNLADFLEMFVMTTLFAWFCTDLIMLSMKFCYKYGKEKRNVKGRLNKLCVDYIEYEAYVNRCNLGYIAEIEKKLVVPRKNKKVDPGMPLLANTNPYSPQKVMISSGANSPQHIVRVPMQNIRSQNVQRSPMQPKQMFVQSVQPTAVPQQQVQYVQQRQIPQQRVVYQQPRGQQQQVIYVKSPPKQRVVYQKVVQSPQPQQISQQQVRVPQQVIHQPLVQQQQPQQQNVQKQQVNEEFVYVPK